jgi:dihydropteroate synthase
MKFNLSNQEAYIMGILNVTPDSFYDGGKYTDEKSIEKKVREMISNGVDIIDIGAESSRPGSMRISSQEEMKRLVPIVEFIRKFISIAAKNNLYICIMHMQNNPENMQNDPKYNNVTKDIFNYLKEKMTLCINYGVEKDKIIIDPGFGFGKTLDHNYTLLKNLDKFSALSNNILIGISRKSMIGNLLDKSVDDRLEGSLAATTISLVNKASIIRTHDVLETKIVSNAIKRIIDAA